MDYRVVIRQSYKGLSRVLGNPHARFLGEGVAEMPLSYPTNCLLLAQLMGEDRQIMNKKELQVIAQAAAKNIKTEADLNEFRQMLTKITVEAALNAELDDHLGFAKNEQSDSDNNRNGYTSKTLQTEDD